MRGHTFFLAAGVALAAWGCTLLLPSDVTQCKVDADCAARGFAGTRCVSNVCVAGAADAAADVQPVDPAWGCIGSVTWGKQDSAQKVWYRARYLKLISDDPVVGMTVQACNRLDPACQSPVGSGTTDSDGYVNLQVPKFFEGSLFLTPPASFPEMVPSIDTVIPPPGADAILDASIPTSSAAELASAAQLNFLLAQIQSQLDPNLGHVFGFVVDCQGKTASNVSLRINPKDKSTIQYYADTNGTPSITATQTSQIGEAGFINAPTGVVTIEATVNSISKKLGTYTVLVKPGTITYLPIPPAPN